MLVLDLSRAWASGGLAPAAALTQEEGYTVPERCTPPALCQGNLLDCNPKAITVRQGKIFCCSHGRTRLHRLMALPLHSWHQGIYTLKSPSHQG